MHSLFFSIACTFLIPFGVFLYYKNHKASCATIQCSEFHRKSCVITGAAGDIGSTTAKHFARKGADLLLIDLPSQSSQLKELQQQIGNMYPQIRVKTYEGDVTSPNDVIGYVDRALNDFGKIDVLFNNAGIQGDILPIHEQDDSKFLSLMKVNIHGVFLGLKYVSLAMMENKTGGVIVNTASLAGLIGPSNMAAYSASKSAVVAMTKTAAKDLAPYNIRVCAIAPGLLEGKMWDTQVTGRIKFLRQDISGDITEKERIEMEQKLISFTPMGRIGTLDEVASAVAFLCSEDASYITGVVLPIDGGRLQ